MAYDLEEQEQLDALKAWWGKYGNFLLTVVTVALVAVAAYQYWGKYEREQAADASLIYEEISRAVDNNSASKAKEAAAGLQEKYGRTVYAPMAALQVAKLSHEAGDLAAAKAQLQWVIDKSKHREFQPIARVRLAGVLLDEKSYDEALKVLDVAPGPENAVAFADRRGDIYFAQGKRDEARKAWQEALDKSDPQHPMRNLIRLKFDALPPA